MAISALASRSTKTRLLWTKRIRTGRDNLDSYAAQTAEAKGHGQAK